MGILSKYIGKIFFKWFSWVSFVLLVIILLFDFVELLRRSMSKVALTPLKVFEMSLLKLPCLYFQVLPFVVLFSAMITFWFFNRSQELTIFRTIGLSVWKIIQPMICGVIFLGGLEVMVLNPLSSVLMLKYEHMEDRYFKGNYGSLAVSGMGMWMREIHENTQSVYSIGHIDTKNQCVYPLTVFQTTLNDDFLVRYDASKGTFHKGFIKLENVYISKPNQLPFFEKNVHITTQTTFHSLQNSGADPTSLSFWQLRDYSRLLEKSGLSAHKYLLQWHSVLSKWVWLMVMVLLATTCCLNPIRQGKTSKFIMSGLLTAFLMYVLKDMTMAMGTSLKISTITAAWAPVFISGLLAITVLLYSEDG